MKKPLSPRKRQSGMMLIEVLVSMLIFAVGLLGTVAMYTRSVQNAIAGEDFARASLLADELVSTMWTSGTVTLPTPTIQAWLLRVDASTTPEAGLPGGTGTVNVAGNLATITITWQPTNMPTGSTNSFMTQVTVTP